MRYWRRTLLSVALLMEVLAAAAFGLEIPKLRGRVNDLAGLLTADEISGLEAKLSDLEASDSTQIAVLIIPGLEGEVLEDYSERVATAWRLGVRGNDNGALLLIALRERRVRIEVGYGLEATLTDALSRRIIEREILAGFRQGNYFGGIDGGVTAMIQAVRGVYTSSSRSPAAGQETGGGRRTADWIIFLLVPFLWILGSTGIWGGGLLGAGAGAYLSYSLAGSHPLALAGGVILGAAAGILLAALARAGGRAGPGGPWGGYIGPIRYGGGGGFGRGGGFSGGGFSGGGGRFGGGGASGGW